MPTQYMEIVDLNVIEDIIENTEVARDEWVKNHASHVYAGDFVISLKEVGALIEGKTLAFNINDGEYHGFLSLKATAKQLLDINFKLETSMNIIEELRQIASKLNGLANTLVR